MSSPKRHHYIPQFYLRGFCRDDYIWVYDRNLNKYRRQTSANIGLQKHYYTFETPDGEKDTKIENMLSQIEGYSKPIIDKINSKEKIDNDEKSSLSVFIGFQSTRIPEFRKSFDDMSEQMMKFVNQMLVSDEARTEKLLKNYEEKTGKRTELTVKDFREFIIGDEYTIEFHDNWSLGSMLYSGFELSKYFLQMDWLILYAPDKTSFITSDAPFVLIPPNDYDPKRPYGVGIITKGARKIIPLSKSACLMMFDKGETIQTDEISRNQVRDINLYVTSNCYRFLFARDYELLKSLVKRTRIDKRNWKSKFRFG